MKKIPLFVLTCLVLNVSAASSFLRGAEEQAPSSEKLIEQLRSDDFDHRQFAAKALEQLGEAARVSLERAVKDDDADVRATALRILAKLSRGTLRLQVLDAEGKPLKSAEGSIALGNVDASDQAARQDDAPFQLDAEGKAEFKLRSVGETLFCRVKFPGFLDSDENGGFGFEAHSGVNPVAVTLRRGGSIAGSVLDPDGKAVPEGSVTLYSRIQFDPEFIELELLYATQLLAAAPFNIAVNPNLNGNAPAKGLVAPVAEDGKWVLMNVPDGVYTCVAQAPGHLPAVCASVRVREGMPTSVSSFEMKKRNAGRIEMRFKKPDGSPKAKEAISYYITPVYSAAAALRLPLVLANVPFHSDQKETDDNGVVAIEDLSPGKYQLAASSEGDGDTTDGPTVLMQTEIEVKPGETAFAEQANAAKPSKKGSIKGRIVNGNGSGAKELNITLHTERDFLALQTGFENLLPGVRGSRELECITDSKGVYRLENVSPGKYVLTFRAADKPEEDSDGYVFGVEVLPESQTLAPKVVLNDSGAPAVMKGRVLMPDGSPAPKAIVHYVSGVACRLAKSGFNDESRQDGRFEVALHDSKVKPDSKSFLTISHSGCKSLLVQGPFAADRDYKLAAQEYGALRVTVADENGKPLAGVYVSPLDAAPNPMEGEKSPHFAITNARGVARLNGLATGARELGATLKGYFLSAHTGKIDVVANTEKEVKLTLHPGVRIEGRVRLPNGYAGTNAVATLDDSNWEPVDANGVFSFTRVTPGEHHVSASLPGLMPKDVFTFILPNESEKIDGANPKNAAIELVLPGGIALDCGPEFAGFSAQLDPVASLDPLNPASKSVNVALGDVDSDGRVEFWAVAPGSYRLSLTDNDELRRARSPYALTVHPIAGPFEVKPVATIADLATLKAVKADLKRGSGTAIGHLQIINPPLQQLDAPSLNVSFQVQGEHTVADGDRSDSPEAFARPATPPVMIGNPPESFKPNVTGMFEMNRLPAGTYSVYATLTLNGPDEAGPALKTSTKKIKTFTIKEGETMNLGEVTFDPFDATLKKKEPMEQLKELLLPEDKPQEFEP